MIAKPKMKVKVAKWVLDRRGIKPSHPIARARGRILDVDGGPHGPAYARVQWSGRMLQHAYSKLDQLEPA